LSVNLHLDKLLPQAEVRGYQPFQGKLTLDLKVNCRVRVRIPEFCQPEEMTVVSGGVETTCQPWGNYLELGERLAGDFIEIQYPLSAQTESVTVGNPGYRQYHYQVTWKGDTVIKMEPIGNDDPTGYSDYDRRQVPVFYGKDGPGLLYQSREPLREKEIQKSSLWCDQHAPNFWKLE
jgi:hypothetical protein